MDDEKKREYAHDDNPFSAADTFTAVEDSRFETVMPYSDSDERRRTLNLGGNITDGVQMDTPRPESKEARRPMNQTFASNMKPLNISPIEVQASDVKVTVQPVVRTVDDNNNNNNNDNDKKLSPDAKHVNMEQQGQPQPEGANELQTPRSRTADDQMSQVLQLLQNMSVDIAKNKAALQHSSQVQHAGKAQHANQAQQSKSDGSISTMVINFGSDSNSVHEEELIPESTLPSMKETMQNYMFTSKLIASFKGNPQYVAMPSFKGEVDANMNGSIWWNDYANMIYQQWIRVAPDMDFDILQLFLVKMNSDVLTAFRCFEREL